MDSRKQLYNLILLAFAAHFFIKERSSGLFLRHPVFLQLHLRAFEVIAATASGAATSSEAKNDRTKEEERKVQP